MTQFEIWFADLPAVGGSIQSGTRPVVIVSNDVANRFSPVITAVPLTSNLHKTALRTLMLPLKKRLSRLILCGERITFHRSPQIKCLPAEKQS